MIAATTYRNESEQPPQPIDDPIGASPWTRGRMVLGEIEVDAFAQRVGINWALVRKIATEFDKGEFRELFVVIVPPGRKVLVDGQHRKLALERRWPERWKGFAVPVQFKHVSSIEEAAAEFRKLNTNRTNVGTRDLFRIGYNAGDPRIREIVRIVREEGFDALGRGKMGLLGKSRLLERLHGRMAKAEGGEGNLTGASPNTLRMTLRALRDAYGNEAGRVGFKTMETVGWLIGTVPNVEHDQLVTALRKRDPVLLERSLVSVQGIDGSSQTNEARKVLINLYNYGKGSTSRYRIRMPNG